MSKTRDALATFYHSSAWKRTAKAYLSSVGGLCERCLKVGFITPADEVHHIQPLTIETMNDPSVSLSFDNLTALCKASIAARLAGVCPSCVPFCVIVCLLLSLF